MSATILPFADERPLIQRVALETVDALHILEDEIDVASFAVGSDEGDHSQQIASMLAAICIRLSEVRARLDEARGV